MRLIDVAEDAGVSRSTVSLVVQGSALVAPATRERVKEAMDRLGYVYNRGAANLRMQRSYTVGVIITDMANPSLADLALGIEAALDAAGYVVFVANTFDDLRRQEALLQAFQERQIDGLLLVPTITTGPATIHELDQVGLPLVLMTRYIEGAPHAYVGPDDERGAELAVEHLVQHGCSTLAYVGGPAAATARCDRQLGFRAALAHADLSPDLGWGQESETGSDAGYQLAKGLLQKGVAPPDGLICHSDDIAVGVMRALTEQGIDVPGQCRIIGFDDVAHARLLVPALTSVSSRAWDVGQQAARMMLEQLRASGEYSQLRVVLEPTLSIRESCGCVLVPRH
jgi:LacI family transcriptional regulator